MGYSCGEIDSDSFSIVTDKSVSKLRGDRIWLISGEGTPEAVLLRRYTSEFETLAGGRRPTGG
jgi:hypothetical protein